MTNIRNFATEEQATDFLRSLGGYAQPPAVAPLKGEAAHEVAVGPVHAGVIEPGHFRFQCVGEAVYNLQIFLGYQHRGVGDEILRADGNLARQVALAETCAGDTSVAAATCFAEIMEARDRTDVGDGRELRALLLELERIANHVGDLGALAGDVAFLPTASFCGRIRGEYLNMTALVCGNRFGRNAIVPGGMRCTLTEAKRARLSGWIRTVRQDLDAALKLMFESPTVCDRFDGTGVVPKAVAERLGLVGVARRASVELNGDVLSRALVRRMEIETSHRQVLDLLAGATRAERTESDGSVDRSGFACIVATTQAWRGPLVHAAVFDPEGRMRAYRIVDPSAHNWQGLAYALRGEQIANFPICNKSFNLSYCGTDC
ncbi:MAG: hypothetical protein ACI4RD_02680 [Kiritimatiellia bacterium]